MSDFPGLSPDRIHESHANPRNLHVDDIHMFFSLISLMFVDFADVRGFRGFRGNVESRSTHIAFHNPNETIGFHHLVSKLGCVRCNPRNPQNLPLGPSVKLPVGPRAM
eukprot:3506076-Pyramimonas_sp.AAC.1